MGLDASRVDRARMTGTERYAREILRTLLTIAPQQDFRIYARSADIGEVLGATNAAIVHIARARLWTHLGLGGEIVRRPPDALFIPAHVLPIAFASRTVRARTRAIVTVHDCGFRHFPRAHTATQRLYLEWSTQFAVDHAHALLADSEATRDDLHRFYPRSRGKVRVAYPGAPDVARVDAAKIVETCARWNVQPREYILHVGTRQPRKNLRRLIDAFAIARRRLPPTTKLVLAGGAGWGGEDLAAHAVAAGVREAIVFTGYIDDDDKAALLRGARALAFPSLHEGFGFPVLEAQAIDLPVACSNTSSLPEAAGDGAVQFDPQNTDAMAQALCDVMLDDALRARLVANGRQNRARFRWDDCARAALEEMQR
jgi:glycosyltransferase involved in cell wall biosynthesis